MCAIKNSQVPLAGNVFTPAASSMCFCIDFCFPTSFVTAIRTFLLIINQFYSAVNSQTF
jgi:hypothetical protein